MNPSTGELWVTEHGPQGGDEVNIALPMRNFGWPMVSYGCNYGDPRGTPAASAEGCTTRPYTRTIGVLVPDLHGAGWRHVLHRQSLLRVAGQFPGRRTCRQDAVSVRRERSKDAIVGQEPFFAGQHEIRDLKQGPDGWIYMISRNTNQIFRIER